LFILGKTYIYASMTIKVFILRMLKNLLKMLKDFLQINIVDNKAVDNKKLLKKLRREIFY
jgi:hypothetical protein